jgi:hypothetical protein
MVSRAAPTAEKHSSTTNGVRCEIFCASTPVTAGITRDGPVRRSRTRPVRKADRPLMEVRYGGSTMTRATKLNAGTSGTMQTDHGPAVHQDAVHRTLVGEFGRGRSGFRPLLLSNGHARSVRPWVCFGGP